MLLGVLSLHYRDDLVAFVPLPPVIIVILVTVERLFLKNRVTICHDVLFVCILTLCVFIHVFSCVIIIPFFFYGVTKALSVIFCGKIPSIVEINVFAACETALKQVVLISPSWVFLAAIV